MENYVVSKEPLISREAIAKRIHELALEIAGKHSEKTIDCVVGVLTGSFMFIADLTRAFSDAINKNFCTEELEPCPLPVHFIKASSYGNETTSSACLQVDGIEELPLKGKNILLIDDILDTGRTLSYLKETFLQHGAANVQTCVLLHKPSRQEVVFDADFVGFTIENHFVVGYGLDFAEKYRHFPDIFTLQESSTTR